MICPVCEGKQIVGRLVETYDADLQRIVPTIIDAKCKHCVNGVISEEYYAERLGER